MQLFLPNSLRERLADALQLSPDSVRDELLSAATATLQRPLSSRLKR